MLAFSHHDSVEAAVDACATLIIRAITDALAKQARTAFMASGGRLPAQVLPRVAAGLHCWDQVLVLASDERYVPADHVDSNQSTIRMGLAATGRPIEYLGLEFSLPLDEACRLYESKLSKAVWPPAVAFLGMGPDGHTASLFPHRPEIDDDAARVLPVPETPPHLHPRLTHGTRSLLEAQQIVLVVNGAEKQAVLERAMRPSANAADTPITKILKNTTTPVHIMVC